MPAAIPVVLLVAFLLALVVLGARGEIGLGRLQRAEVADPDVETLLYVVPDRQDAAALSAALVQHGFTSR